MSGVCQRPKQDNEPVSKRTRENDYAAHEFPESLKDDLIMATDEHIANIIAQVKLAM